MGRPKKYPDYDPEWIMNDLLIAVTELYGEGLSLREISDELDMDWQKVRKLLCTASYIGLCVYESDTADAVQDWYRQGKSTEEIMELTGLSRASIQSYLPYIKVPYKETVISANAERLRVFQKRKRAVEKLRQNPDSLWEAITVFQNYPFQTVSGLKFKYTIRGGEMAVNRKEKTITRGTVELAYQKVRFGTVTGPKQLGVFGASYLYSVFVRIGVIDVLQSEN